MFLPERPMMTDRRANIRAYIIIIDWEGAQQKYALQMDQQTYVQTKPLLESQVVGGTSKAKDCKTEQIHGYPSRVQVGRGSDGEGHWGIWAGAVRSKCF